MTWLAWSPEAFRRAKAQGKPVLAALGPLPPEDLKLAEGEIARRFIPVLADPQTRPDAAARIGADCLVVLGPDGARRGRLALPAANLAAELEKLAADASAQSGSGAVSPEPAWTGAVREKPHAAASDAGRVAAVFAALPSVREPGDAVLETLLYAAAERGDDAARAALERGLARMLDTTWDPGRRSFFPRTGPALSVHARRARLLWDAHALTGGARWREAASAATSFLLHTLREPGHGAFRAAPGAAVYPADGNALAALALLRAAAFETPEAADAATRALTFLQTRLYDPLLGLVHAQGGDGESVHGLLGDAAWTALAFTEAFLAGGVKQHREFADGLLRFLFQELWERDGGGFLDRVPRAEDPAILRETRVDPELNAVAFKVCWRLHHLKGNANYKRWLDWGLRGAWPAGETDPARLAGLARAADLAGRGRAHFELVGRRGEAKSEVLLNAFRRHFAPRAILSFVDPDDQDYILAHKLEADTYPRLFGCGTDLRPLASADAPEGVGAVLAAVRAAEAK
ncbi:MAG TPA: hypothetical protein VN915_10860 [Elusimicrobiota bacterium]|nr:hypothetical protein [Elusimicrobiota bacterium]